MEGKVILDPFYHGKSILEASIIGASFSGISFGSFWTNHLERFRFNC